MSFKTSLGVLLVLLPCLSLAQERNGKDQIVQVDDMGRHESAVRNRLAELGGAERVEQLSSSAAMLVLDSLSVSQVDKGAMSIELTHGANGFRTLQLMSEDGMRVSLSGMFDGTEWKVDSADYFDGINVKAFVFVTRSGEEALLSFGAVPRFDRPQLARSVLTAEVSSALSRAAGEVVEGVQAMPVQGVDTSCATVGGGSIPLTFTGADVLIDDEGVVFFLYVGEVMVKTLVMNSAVPAGMGAVARAEPTPKKDAVCRRLFSLCIGSDDDRAAAIACAAWLKDCQSSFH